MSQYMATIEIPEILTQEIIELIPAHRSKVNELMIEGQILNYSLASDRSKLWILVSAENEEEVTDILSDLPIMPWLTIRDVEELMFHHERSGIVLPRMSLN